MLYLVSMHVIVDLIGAELTAIKLICGGSGGVVLRALTFHQCGLGSISRFGVGLGELSLLVLFSALRGFPPGTLVFPSSQKPALD